MSKESSTGREAGVWRVDSKLDPGLQSDRAAGKAVTPRLFWAVCGAGLRQSVGSGQRLCGNRSLPAGSKNTLGGVVSPRETRRGGSEDSHWSD